LTLSVPSTPRASESGRLLVTCPDRRGIVAALAQLLYGQGANILDSDQHTDPEAGIFFQRIRFDLADLRVDRQGLERAIAEVAERMNMTWRLEFSDPVKRMAIFVSKQDHCLYDLLLRHRAGEFECEIPLIVSNHPDAKSIAEQFDVAFEVFPIAKDTRREQEQREIELLRDHRIDLIVMARYMQILSDDFITDFGRPIINIHHSFLPAFVGGKPYHQAHERGVKLIGATAHYATVDLDEGPIIEQDVIRAGHANSVRDLSRKGRDVERLVLCRAVRWHLEDRVLVYGNRTVVFS